MERLAWLATAWRLGRYYRTYAAYVQDEVEADSYLEVMEQLCLQAEPPASTVGVLRRILADT